MEELATLGHIKPQPKILASWRILLGIVMLIPAFLSALFFRVPSRFWVASAIVWITVFLALYLIYLPLRYRNLSFSVSEEKILLYSGVVYVRVRSIPLRNVQFTTVNRNPFERLFGLCSLVVVSAGGRAVLPGLRVSDAEALAAALLEPRG